MIVKQFPLEGIRTLYRSRGQTRGSSWRAQDGTKIYTCALKPVLESNPVRTTNSRK